MLFEYLEQVRQQPKEVRRRFAFVWSLIVTGIIVIVWLSVLFGRSYALREAEPTVEEQQELQLQDIRESFDAANDFLFDPALPESIQLPDASSTEPTSTSSDVGISDESVVEEQVNDVTSNPSTQKPDSAELPSLPEL